MSEQLTYDEIVAYLLSLGVTKTAISKCPQQIDALQKLATAAGGSLYNKAEIKASYARSQKAAKDQRSAGKTFRKLSQREVERIRLAFDHFDADSSGKLDIEEFRKAMIDCGMMPLGFEVQELFDEADVDGSKDVDFVEYCRFVQLYKSKQNLCEKLMECFMDALSPKPVYLTDPVGKFLLKMHAEGCNAATIGAVKMRGNKACNSEFVLALSSDAYEETADYQMGLRGERGGVAPIVKLGSEYKSVDALKGLVPSGAPSLLRCSRLEIKGKVVLAAGVVFEGEVVVIGGTKEPFHVAPGVYADCTLEP